MEVKFKPKFWRDLNKLKNEMKVVDAFSKILQQVEKAKNIDEINNIKKLDDYESRFRIKLFFDKQRDYRIGLYIHRETLWFARFLHRRKIYNENW